MGPNRRKNDGRPRHVTRHTNATLPNGNGVVCSNGHSRQPNGIQQAYSTGRRKHQHSGTGQAWDWQLVEGFSMEYGVIATTLLAAALYLNTLTAEFAYDDSRAILKNPDLLPSTPLSSLFHDDFWGTPLTHSGSHKSYRPLCVLSFRINYFLGGFSPWGYHLGNVILHAIVTGLFTYTAKLLLWRPSASLVAGGLFAAHPIHTEAVAGIVGRADILSCLFFLLAFLCYMKYCAYRGCISAPDMCDSKFSVPSLGGATKARWLWLLGAAVCTLAAMLSKELGITVLAVCGVYDVFLVCRVKVKDIWRVLQCRYRPLLEGLLCLGAIGSSLVVFRILFMGSKPPEFAPADNPASDSDSLLTRTLTYHYLPVVNLWLLLFPKVLSFDWSMGAVPLVESVSDPRNLCTLALYSVLGYAVWYLIQHLNCAADERTTSTRRTKTHNGNGYHHTNHVDSCHGNGHATVIPVKQCSHGNGIRRKLSARRGSWSSTDSSSQDEGSTSTPGSAQIHVAHAQHTLQLLTLATAFLVCPFVPATNLFFYVGFVIAERVLYIPSVGLCLLVAQGVDNVLMAWCQRRPAVYGRLVRIAVVTLLLAYSVRTVLRNQDWSSEEKLYRAGIPVNPAKAWGNLANILNNHGKHGEAEQAYRSALQYRGNMADVHYNLGILLQEQKRYQEAIESYRLAIQCRPRLTMAHLNLGIVYANIGLRVEAEEMYRTCAAIDISGLKDPRLHEQTKISALYNLGRLLADQDKYKEAIDIYQEAIRRRPNHYAPQSLYNMLGEAYSKLDHVTEAEQWYKEALKAKADHIPAHLTMGKLLLRRGHIQEGESWFLKARDLDPEDSSVYQHYGQFLSDIGRHDEAAESYLKASHYNPTDFELVFNTANALRQAQRNEDAEEYYRRAVKLQPKEATAHMNLGAMLHFNGRHREAELSYLSALQLRPNDTITRNNLQKVRNLINKTKGATNGNR